MLNPKHYQEFNEVIANFMELKKEENKWISPVNGSKIVNLKYHESWDWIMPVVEKLKDYETEHWFIDFRLHSSKACIYGGDPIDPIANLMKYEPDEPTWLLKIYASSYKLIKWINENL